MALNNFMHPRNIYKTPPDFGILAKSFPLFANIAKTDVSGKVSIDFKDPKALRVLTQCLLKSDFNIEIEIPEDKLVPTLPLRLNYILWIEDLLAIIGKEVQVKGIDIGTGACAIYPILGAVKNNWLMIGTDIDTESIQKAKENVEKNDLSAAITLCKNDSSTIIGHVLEKESKDTFEFCMCNPPFYSSVQDLCSSRDPTRHPPKNGFTGSPQELITEGGELNFCRKLVNESKQYPDRVKIYTTMIGHKYNLKELIQDLTADGLMFTHTEFCQGRVTRWGLAWTFQEYNLYNLVPPREKNRKKNTTSSYLLPEITGHNYSVDTTVNKIISMLSDLHVSYKTLNKRGNFICLHISAIQNTWSHQRRKRRMLKRLDANDNKKIRLSTTQNNSTSSISVDSAIDIDDTSLSNNNTAIKNSDIKDTQIVSTAKDVTAFEKPIVEAFFKVFKKDKDILLEVEFLNGSAGKEGLHQIVQFIKNNWK